jgi:mannose-6-phosphate isomerase-like protein (cupin superfamily)
METRPWGTYETLRKTSKFHSKEIIVKPNQRLSLQSHNKRSEHWIIVQGIAVITLEGDEINISENQHVYIPKKTKHRICNIGTDDLIFIEVQIGDYFEEDDITRYSDDYNR